MFYSARKIIFLFLISFISFSAFANNFELILKAANKGDPESLRIVGDHYLYGKSVKKDYEKARSYYLKAAKKGDRNSFNQLGILYSQGLGVKQSDKKAFEYYQQGAKKGDAFASYNIGLSYMDGDKAVKKNDKQAEKFFLQSIAQTGEEGSFCAQHDLAVLYVRNNGVKKNEKLAEKYFRQSMYGGIVYSVNFGDHLELVKEFESKPSKFFTDYAYQYAKEMVKKYGSKTDKNQSISTLGTAFEKYVKTTCWA